MTHLPRLLTIVLLALSSAATAAEPWRLDDVLPERLSLTVESRARYEFLDDQFRASTRGDADVLALRTLIHGKVKLLEGPTRFGVGAEFMDSRAWLEDGPIGTSVVNAAELLRAYAVIERDGLFGGTATVRGGRLTMDVGSRRFVARNRFRNTINGFTGIDAEWHRDERVVRGFWLLPVLRLPVLPNRVRDDDVAFDEESLDRQFWGLFVSDALGGGLHGEAFVLGIHERDAPNRPTRNRRLVTPGFRIWRAPEGGQWDYMLESALQFGQSRLSVLGNRDLDHFAWFVHAEAGHSFEAPWSPRVLAQFDYASGDENPSDGRNQRFDTLFGARRFDFGPTGIYGPFVRANLVTPGVRLQVKPVANVTSFVALRGFWLASDRDAWVGTGLQDPTGRSGSYLGTQIEWRVRWSPLPGNLQLEGGIAHLFAGDYRDVAPRSNGQGDTTFLYVSASIKI